MKITVAVNLDAHRLAMAAERLARGRAMADAATSLDADLAAEQALASGASGLSSAPAPRIPDAARAAALARAARRLAGRGDA